MSGQAQRRLILRMSASLDGFIGHRDGTIEWLGASGEHGAARHHAI